MPTDKIDQRTMDMQEQLDTANEISDPLSTPIMANDFNDDEVLNLLALLVQIEAIIQLNNLILTLRTIIAFSGVFYRLCGLVIATEDQWPKSTHSDAEGRGGLAAQIAAMDVLLDMAKEISGALSAPVMANDFDDDEVLNLLALLVQKESIIQLNNLILTLKTM